MPKTGILYSLKRKSKLSLSVLFIGFAFVTQSQTLAEFERASTKTGVNSIPYSDLQSKAGTLQGQKDRANDAVSGYNVRPLSDAKTNLLRIVKEVEEDLETAKKNLAADKKESSSETTKLKNEVLKNENELKKLAGEIKTLNDKIEDGIEKWHALNLARAAVGKVYEEVDDKLDVSLSHPEKHIGTKPSSSDADATKKYNSDLTLLKQYISKIKTTMENGVKQHKQVVQEAIDAEANLKKALTKTSY